MTYKSFRNEHNKIYKTWNKTEDNKNDLLIKVNKQKSYFNLQKIKTDKPIYDSGWIKTSPSSFSETTTKAGTKLPMFYNFKKEVDLNIDDFLIPFIQWSLQARDIPNTEILPFVNYTQYTNVKNITVLSDDIVIYKGSLVPSISTLYNDNDIANGVVNKNFLKKTYNASITYIFNGNTYVVSGKLSGIKKSNELIYLKGENSQSLPQFNGQLSKTIINNIDNNNTVSGVWMNIGTGLLTSASNIITEGSLSINDRVYFDSFSGVSFSKNGISLNYLSENPNNHGYEVINQDFAVKGDSVSGVSLTFAGKWLYYNINTNHRVSVGSLSLPSLDTCRTTDLTLQLLNLPTIKADGDFSTNTFKLNIARLNIGSQKKNNTSGTKQIYFKNIDGKYRFIFSTEILVLQQVEFFINNNKDQYNLVYTKTQTGVDPNTLDDIFDYQLNDVSCANISISSYTVPSHDIEVKLIGRLANPLFYTEQKRLEQHDI